MTVLSHFASNYLSHVIQGDKKECLEIARKYLDGGRSMTELYEKVLKQALYEVGRLWESNKISVATEHMSTAITESILNELYYDFNFNVNENKKVVLACAENEQHQVGIKMVGDVFEKHGWDTFFLGTGIPVTELISFIHEKKPDALAISLSIYFNYRGLNNMLIEITNEFPNLEILLGGQAFSRLSAELVNNFPETKIINSLYDLNQYLETKPK